MAKRLISNGGELLASTSRAVASMIGVVAGFVGVYHGYDETLQGGVAPTGIIINAIGPPCQGNGCFTAMTVIPSLFVAGVLAIIIVIMVLV